MTILWVSAEYVRMTVQCDLMVIQLIDRVHPQQHYYDMYIYL